MAEVNVNYNLLAQNQDKLFDIKKETLKFLKFHKIIEGETANLDVKQQFNPQLLEKRVELQRVEGVTTGRVGLEVFSPPTLHQGDRKAG